MLRCNFIFVVEKINNRDPIYILAYVITRDSRGTNVTLQVSAHPASTYQPTVKRSHLYPHQTSGKTVLLIHLIDTILIIIVIASIMGTIHSTIMHTTVSIQGILTPRDILTIQNTLTIQDTITSSIPTARALLDTIKT